MRWSIITWKRRFLWSLKYGRYYWCRLCDDADHDLYVQSDTLLLSDVFESFRIMCIEIYKRESEKFLPAPGLAWKATLKKTKYKPRFFNWYRYVINGRKGIRGGICYSAYWYAKSIKKYKKDYDKNKKKSYLQCWNENDLYGWAMSQKLPVNHFEWIKDISQFNKGFIKSYNEESDEGCFL